MSNSSSVNAVRRLVDPLKDSLYTEAAGGLFLLAATVVVLGWANSPLGGGYRGVVGAGADHRAGPLSVTEDLKHWVNDGLMAVFFCMVGLEINSSSTLFALANAGMPLNGNALGRAAHNPVAWGVALGLLVGKILGMVGTSLVAVRLRLGSLPGDLTMRHVLGLAALAGIGFTVSLFIAELAYPGSELVDLAKVGIPAGSLASGLAGAALLATGATHAAGTRRPPQSMEREHRDRPPAAQPRRRLPEPLWRRRSSGAAARADRPVHRTFLGNYPQAFSHVGLISSAVNLARTCREAARLTTDTR